MNCAPLEVSSATSNSVVIPTTPFDIFSHYLGGSWWPESQSKDCRAKQWDSQGPPPRQWGKKQHPLTNHTA